MLVKSLQEKLLKQQQEFEQQKQILAKTNDDLNNQLFKSQQQLQTQKDKTEHALQEGQKLDEKVRSLQQTGGKLET